MDSSAAYDTSFRQGVTFPYNAAAIYIGGPEEKEDTFVFRNSLPGEAAPLVFNTRLQGPEREFKSGFSVDLTGEDQVHQQDLENHSRDRTHLEPLSLILRRQTHSDQTQLCDAINYETIYTIQETHRGFFSSQPDLRIFRTTSGDELIGTVRYGVFSNHTTSVISGRSRSKINRFSTSLFRLEGSSESDDSCTWRLVPRKQRPKSRIMMDGTVQLKVTEPLIRLNLVGHEDSDPLCVVSVFTSRPVGIVEVFAPQACINHDGGDWFALDELVLSAYANMERERRRLMDRNALNWKEITAGLVLCTAMVVLYVVVMWLWCGKECYGRHKYISDDESGLIP